MSGHPTHPMSAPTPARPDKSDPSASESAGTRVAFVSRSAPEPARDDRPTDAHGGLLPSLRDPGMRRLMLLVLALQALSWWILDGYQLADSVEYMERAQAFVRSQEVVDSTSIRSFAFSALLVPIFTVADWLGIDDFKPVVWMVRLVQALFGLLLVRTCARIGARLGGRRTGIVAGFLVGMNPVFLQYSVSPVSGVAAAVFIGHAIESVLDRATFKRGLRAGLWMGLAMMMAYQSILIIGPLWLAFFLRERWKGRAGWGGALVGLGAGLLLQVVLDKLTYDEWGVSISRHFLSHAGPNVADMLARLGFIDQARALYEVALRAIDANPVIQSEATLASVDRLFPVDWYLTNLHRMLVWPVIGFGVLGLFLAVKRANVKSTLLLFVFAVNLYVMSLKGSKDFRLWLPLLPTIAPICALGFDFLLGARGQRNALRVACANILLIATAAIGVQTLLDRNTRRFSGYWDAMRMIDTLAAEDRQPMPDTGELPPKARASSAYHWAVYLRESKDVDLVKLPHHLDHWVQYTPAEREESLEAIAELDYFITHLAVLSNPEHSDLMAHVNGLFEIEAMLWDQAVFEHIGPVLVLRKRTGDPGAKTFFEVIEGEDPQAYRRRLHLPPPTRFVRRLGDDLEQIELLGWEFQELRGHDHGWITYHWYCGSKILGDYTVVDRLTTFDEHNSWQNNHAPAYGVHRTPDWQPGWIVRESWPVVAAADPYNWKAAFRPMGGPYRRGDLMPANLWMDLATFGAEGEITGRLEPAYAGEDEPMRRDELEGVLRTAAGVTFSKDDLVRVGRLFLPVHVTSRLGDDGRPLRD
ncbi:MAG: hypothetical protein ACI8QZ_002842 [Chlamydiales bacterium]|jgi:hypothetical protein